MFRCIVERPTILALRDNDGGSSPFMLSKAIGDLPDGHPAVVQAPWAFESLNPPPPRRGRPPKNPVAD